MKTTHKILIAIIGIALAAGATASLYLYKTAQREKELQAQRVLDEGIALYKRTNYEETLQTLKTITAGASQDWRVPYYKGAASVRLKNYQTAAPYLEQAKSLNSSEPEILYLLGVVYFKLGDLKLSEGYFAATLELDPSHEQAKGLMGVMANLQQRQPPSTDPAQDSVPVEDP